MKNKEKSKNFVDDFDYLSNSVSSTDCTGLIPSMPQNEYELESYNDVYQYRPPVIKSPKKNERGSEHGKS